MAFKKDTYFYSLLAFIFLGVFSVDLFSDGMFMDGLIYASISRNMAEGFGTFWKPQLSETLFAEFYEHPPLAVGIQSIWFRVFGDTMYVERFYSLFSLLVTGWLIVLIWKEITHELKNAWLPLLFWVLISDVGWSAANNMLENTMSVFVCLSVLFYFKSKSKRRIFWLILSGFSLSAGLLSKGFVCLYIWSFPFFDWLFKRDKNFAYMTTDSIILVFSTIIPIAWLYFFIPEAQNFMLNYFNKQVLDSISSVQTVATRFAILRMFFEKTILPLSVAGILILTLKQRDKKELLRKNAKEALVFLLVVFSGILPIMISMKQRSFYILTVYPFFAIGLAYYIYPVLSPMVKKIKTKPKSFKTLKIITLSVISISILFSVSQINRIGRDKTKVKDSKAIIQITGKNRTIAVCPKLYSDWSLHGYFARYGKLSLDPNLPPTAEYYLTTAGCKPDYPDKRYKLVPAATEKYQLYVETEK